MLISNVHKSIIVMNSLDTRFSKNVFEAVQKTRSTCFIGSKTTRLHLVVLNPIKHSCSFFKHYLYCLLSLLLLCRSVLLFMSAVVLLRLLQITEVKGKSIIEVSKEYLETRIFLGKMRVNFWN